MSNFSLNLLKRVQSSNFTNDRSGPDYTTSIEQHQALHTFHFDEIAERPVIRKANTETKLNTLNASLKSIEYAPGIHGANAFRVNGLHSNCSLTSSRKQSPSHLDYPPKPITKFGKKLSIFDDNEDSQTHTLSNRDILRSPLRSFENLSFQRLTISNRSDPNSEHKIDEFKSQHLLQKSQQSNLVSDVSIGTNSEESISVFEKVRRLESQIQNFKESNEIKSQEIKILNKRMVNQDVDLKCLYDPSTKLQIKALREDNAHLKAWIRDLEDMLGTSEDVATHQYTPQDFEAKILILENQNRKLKRNYENYKQIVEQGSHEDIEECTSKIHDLEILIKDLKRKNDRLEAQLSSH